MIVKKGKKFDKTEESLFTLMSLYALIEQAFESLTGTEDILDSNFDESHRSFKDLMNNTIQEALVYQILLKACAFLDEWNTVFGINTEINDKETILKVKKIAKPAHKCISEWKDLRNFRNQAIAHNHRNKKGENIYINQFEYDSPQNVREIYLLVYCLKQMMNVVRFFFKDSLENIVIDKLQHPDRQTKIKIMNARKIKKKIKTIDEQITGTLIRINVLSGIFGGLDDASSVGIAISDGLDGKK